MFKVALRGKKNMCATQIQLAWKRYRIRKKGYKSGLTGWLLDKTVGQKKKYGAVPHK